MFWSGKQKTADWVAVGLEGRRAIFRPAGEGDGGLRYGINCFRAAVAERKNIVRAAPLWVTIVGDSVGRADHGEYSALANKRRGVRSAGG